MTILCYLVLGAVSGFVAGLLGVGGGVIIVPALLVLFTYLNFSVEVIMHMAIATSLAAIIPISIASARTHYRHDAIIWGFLPALIPGIILGGLLGAYIAANLQTNWLKYFFSIFVLVIAIQMIFRITPRIRKKLPNRIVQFLMGILIAMSSAMAGIGGGSFTVPFLVWCRFPLKKAVGTAALCGLPIALAGSFGFIFMGLINQALPAWSIGYIYMPALVGIIPTSIIFARIGAKMTHKVSINMLRHCFAIFLLIVGCYIMFR